MLDSSKTNTLRIFRNELINLVEAVSQSIVTIRIDDVTLRSGSGSGWFFQPGIIVTNNHVVDGSSPKVKIRLKGGRVVPGEIVGTDPMTDLAVIQCKETTIECLQLNKEKPRLGELCFAFGSPLGEYTESVTFGIVSGLGRRMEHEDGKSIEDLIQTDAEINPGNSGGPLVDLDGELLGVNVMIRTDGRGMGFAIPSNTVASIVPEILEYGDVLRPKLGVALEVIETWDKEVGSECLRVANAPEESPFQRGDIVLAVAGKEINARSDFFEVMRRPLLGSKTFVTVEREGVQQQISILLMGSRVEK